MVSDQILDVLEKSSLEEILMRGKESWRTPRVWPEYLEGWNCHQLRRIVGRVGCGKRIRSSVWTWGDAHQFSSRPSRGI